MADRVVSVKLELDVAGYLAKLREAQTATKNFGDSGSAGVSKTDGEVKKLGDDVENVGNKSDTVRKKTEGNETANQHTYSRTRGQVLAITALLTNLPAIVAPALGLLLAVPGAIALAGVAAGTTGLAVKGLGDAFKGLSSNDVDKIAKSMDTLAPSAQAFVHEVQGVRSEWGHLQDAVQQETFAPIVGKLGQLGTTILPMLNVELPQIGRSIGNIAAGTADWLANTETVNRFAFLLNDVRTQLDHVLPILRNWSNAFLDISHVASPFLVNLLDILGKLGARFTAFIDTAKNTGQLDTLFKTTTLGVQELLNALAKLADALFTILASPGTLQAARVLFNALNLLATAVDAIAKAFTMLPGPVQATLLVLLAIGGVLPLLAKGFTAIHTAVAELGAKWTAFKAGADGAAASTQRFGFSAETAAASTSRMRAGVSGLMGSLGGPWGLAITAATIGLGLLAIRMGEQKQAAEAATQAYFDFGEAVAAARAKGEDNTEDLIRQNKTLQDLIISADKYGVSASDVANALSGQKTAVDSVKGSLMDYRAQLLGARTAAERVTATDQVSIAAKAAKVRGITDEISKVDKLIGQFDTVTRMQNRATEATDLYTKSLGANAAGHEHQAALFGQLTALLEVLQSKTATAAQKTDAFTATINGIAATAGPAADTVSALVGMVDAFSGVQLTATQRAGLYKAVLTDIGAVAEPLKDKVHALTDVFWSIADSELSASQKADLLKQAWTALYQPQIDVTNATQEFNLGLNTLAAQLDKGSNSLSINETAGIKNRKAVEDLILKNNDLYFANIAAGMSAEDAGRKHDENGRLIEDAGHKAGLTTGEVHGLNAEYGSTPGKVETNIVATGVDAVLNQLRVLKVAQYALDNNVSTAAAASAIAGQSSVFNSQVPFAARFVQGGPIIGPGTGTSDSIRAAGPGAASYWLSAGEHVWTAEEVQAAGGHAAIEWLRKTVLHNRSPKVQYPGDGSQGIAFAGGGQVWPFPVNVSGTKMPYTMAQLEAKFGGGPALAFLKAQVGKPYVWASAGPGGYDCSGIVSAVWNVLHKRSPYSHTFSTFNEAPYFPLGGVGGALSAGWTNPGEPGPGGTSVGHTAGLLGGLPFESTGGVGVRVGGGVTDIHRFAHVGHFDNGGWLRPGVTLAVNSTGQSERVTPGNDKPMRLVGRVIFDTGGGQTLAGYVDGRIGANDQVLARTADLVARGG